MTHKRSQANPKSELLSPKLIALISSTAGQDKGLKKALQLVQRTVRFDVVIILHYNEQERNFELIEQYGLSTKQLKSLNNIFSYVFNYAIKSKKPRGLPKNHGIVLNFTENEITMQICLCSFSMCLKR